MRSLQWDIFCKVIDNFGDIGVCWRLATDLAARGQRVRLWVDDSTALAWMAPGGCDGVQVMAWIERTGVSVLDTAPCDVLIEAFGCDVATEFIAVCARIYLATSQKGTQKPLWINLEYLSAEPYVARSHGLSSLISSGPAAGWRKTFYYPGFTPETGGLLREPDLIQRQRGFDRAGWLQQRGIDCNEETVVSLFCYEPRALAQLLNDLANNGLDVKPVRLLVAAGRATQAVKTLVNMHQISLHPNKYGRKQLSISYFPLLTQTDFDHLLWASDINFVRGEDSLVRALWAGKPFVWQIYPQSDGAHGPKLEAFMDMLGASHDVQAFLRCWNGLTDTALPPLPDLDSWRLAASKVRLRLLQNADLTTGLIELATENR